MSQKIESLVQCIKETEESLDSLQTDQIGSAVVHDVWESVALRSLIEKVWEKGFETISVRGRTIVLVAPISQATSIRLPLDLFPYSHIAHKKWLRENPNASIEDIQEAEDRAIFSSLDEQDIESLKEWLSLQSEVASTYVYSFLRSHDALVFHLDRFQKPGRPRDLAGETLIRQVRRVLVRQKADVRLTSTIGGPFFNIMQELFEAAGVHLSEDGLRSKIRAALRE